MNKPSISIIIPVYNVEPYIEACLNSVIHQSYDGMLECIVVDDCGTDNSMAVVEKMITEYKGSIVFRIIHHKYNRGLSAARNSGIETATGDYIFFLDGDDYLSDYCIEKMVEPLYDYWYDVVVGNYQHVNENRTPIASDYVIKLHNKTKLKQNDILQAYSKGYITPVAWGRLFRSNFIRNNNLFFKEGILHEDELWSFQVFCLSDSLLVVNHVLYFYRRRKGSITFSREINISTHLATIVVEDGLFVKKINKYNKAIYLSIRVLFYLALECSMSEPSLFIHEYKTMRQYFKPSFLEYYKVNKKNITRFLRDIHILLPMIIAPYYEYSTKVLLLTMRKK